MVELVDYKDDMKSDLPSYKNGDPAERPVKTRNHKKLACAAAALYLIALAFFYRGAIFATSMGMLHRIPGFGGRDHHHHHHHPHHHKAGRPFDPREGPFYMPHAPARSDITEDRTGLPLYLEIEVLDRASSSPVANLTVDVWQADAAGNYSGHFRHMGPPHHGKHGGPPGPPPPPHHGKHGEHGGPPGPPPPARGHRGNHEGPSNGRPRAPKEGGRHHGPRGEEDNERPHEEKHSNHAATWLRGVQKTSKDGKVLFNTIFPGPDCRRASHIHFKVYEKKQHREHKAHNHEQSDESSELLGHADDTEAPRRHQNEEDRHERKEHKKHDGEKKEHKKHDGAKKEHKKHGGCKKMKPAALLTDSLFFEDDLVAKVLELAEYKDAKKQIKLADDPFFHEHGLISEVTYVKEGQLEAGLKAKLTVLVNAPELVKDEFTDSDSD